MHNPLSRPITAPLPTPTSPPCRSQAPLSTLVEVKVSNTHISQHFPRPVGGEVSCCGIPTQVVHSLRHMSLMDPSLSSLLLTVSSIAPPSHHHFKLKCL